MTDATLTGLELAALGFESHGSADGVRPSAKIGRKEVLLVVAREEEVVVVGLCARLPFRAA